MVRAGPGESSAVPAQDVSGTVRSSRGCLTLFPAPLGYTGFCMVLCLHTAQDGTVALGQAPLLWGPFSLSRPVGPDSAMLSDHTHTCAHMHTLAPRGLTAPVASAATSWLMTLTSLPVPWTQALRCFPAASPF